MVHHHGAGRQQAAGGPADRAVRVELIAQETGPPGGVCPLNVFALYPYQTFVYCIYYSHSIVSKWGATRLPFEQSETHAPERSP